ncbi:hypothetical protein JCM11251_007230 [Rhodosporidiobolus azoricus]
MSLHPPDPHHHPHSHTLTDHAPPSLPTARRTALTPVPDAPPPPPLATITLDTFQSASFDVARFVTALMEEDVRRAKADGAAFDPAPHVRTLEAALAQLLPLRKANAHKTSELERQVAVAERAYRGDVRGAKAGFETVNTQFQTLDQKITSVGRTAVRIGEQLESIDRLRQRGSEAHDLILYYNEFAAGDTSRLERMRKEGGREGRQKVAVAARRLLSLSKEVEGVEGAEKTRETIERYCERFEKDMLRLFDRYYRKGDPKAMAHCAQTLQDFNGGQSCIQIYVNQHDFFISKERVQEVAGGLVGGAIWDSLPDPDSPAPKSEPGLSNLYDEIRVTVGQEAQIVTAVFPHPAVVMQVFLQRVFAQVIQGYIETLIDTASQSSTLAYLRILHLARSQTNTLVEDLRSHEFFRSSSAAAASSALTGPSLLNPLGLPSTVGGAIVPASSATSSANGTGSVSSPAASAAFPAAVVGGAGGVGIAAVSHMLDQSMDELFVPYMEGTRYLDKEGKSLTELYAGKLIRFTNWHRATNKAKPSNTLFDRMVNQLSSAAHQAAHPGSSSSSSHPSGPTPSSDHPAAAAGDSSRLDRLMKFSGLSTIVDKASSSSSSAPSAMGSPAHHGGEEGIRDPEMMFEEGDGELSVETAEKMLEWHAEAVGRMVELSPAGEVPKNAFSLLKVLADSFGKAYLETALDTAIHQLSLYDGKAEPDLSPISVIRTADMIMHLWQRYISTALVPLAGTSVTVRREMGIFNNHVSVRIEGKVNAIVQRTTDAIVTHLSLLLSKQKKLDFKPKNDDVAFSRLNTEPCLLACDFLVKVREAANKALSGRNCEVFLTEVGVTFHTLLLEHLKKFPISATGGLMLTKDLALYQDTFSTFSLPALNDRFEMLRQLGNVFIVQPDILKSYLNEAYLARIENRLLRPYVMMRSDYSDFSRKFWDDVFGPDELPAAAAAGGAAAAAGSIAGGISLGLPGLGSVAGKLPSLSSFTSSATSTFSQIGSHVHMPGQGGHHPSPSVSASATTSNTAGLSHSADPAAAARKQSLFGNLMKDFEGLGLKDEHGGGGYDSGSAGKRGSVAGSIRSIRSIRGE